MIEGVLVVNEQGRVQLVNAAARRMLRLQDAPRAATTSRSSASRTSPRRSARRSRGSDDRGPRAGAAARAGSHHHRAQRAGRVAERARGAVLVLHDITELRRADRIRRDFVANVSHELRTPLTAVRGYVEALLDGGTDTPDARRFLEIIGAPHAADGAAGARPAAAGPARRRPGAARARAVLGRVAVRRRRDRAAPTRSRRANRCVEHQIAADATTVTGDPAKLHDALRNLLENAVELRAGGGPDRDGVGRDGRSTAADGQRSAAQASRSRPAAHLRALLSRRQGALTRRARSRRHRARPRDRQAPDRAARRNGHGRQPAGRRRDVHDRVAGWRDRDGRRDQGSAIGGRKPRELDERFRIADPGSRVPTRRTYGATVIARSSR